MATIVSTKQNGSVLRLEYTYTQNIENNTTKVNTELYLDIDSGWFLEHYVSSMSNRIDGVTKNSYSNTYKYYGAGTHKLASSSSTLTHKSDGTRTTSLYGALVMGNIFDKSVSRSSWVLPTIPRATTPAISGGGGFTTGSESQINLPRASSGFTHDVTYKIGSKTGTIATGAGVSTKWTPAHSLATEFTKATSGTVEITVVTKNGSTVIGTKKVSFSLALASSQVPTVSSVTWEDANSTVKNNIGAFIQGRSLVKGSVAASGIHGSTISKKEVVVAGQTLPENQPIQINGSGTITASGRATDSRGRIGTLAANFDVLAYSDPKLGSNGWNVQRANAANVADPLGQYLRLDLHAVASPLIVDTEKNAMKIEVFTKASNGSEIARNVINPGLSHNGEIQVSGGGVFLPGLSYDVRVLITDNAGGRLELVSTVSTAVVSLHLGDNGLGVGKYHEQGALDVAGDGYFAGKVHDDSGQLSPAGSITMFGGSTAPDGWLLCQGQAVSRATYSDLFAAIGTTYGAGNGSTTFNVPNMQGRAPVGFSSGETEFNTLGKTGGAKTHTLTTAQMPSHSHSASTSAAGAHTHRVVGGNAGTSRLQSSQGYPAGSASSRYGPWFGGGYNATDNVYTTSAGSHSHTVTVNSSGSGDAHNNLQPYMSVNFIIKY